jgi:hypothetical protein
VNVTKGFLGAPCELLVQARVDADDLRDPALPLTMLERQNLRVRPIEVKRDIRYLLVQPL